jgi:type I restriction enzyme, S subunit
MIPPAAKKTALSAGFQPFETGGPRSMTLSKGWKTVRLGDVADINLRPKKDELDDEMLASFVPMKSVEGESGKFTPLEDRPVGKCRKGYTPFRDGDVLFAKVTPCMENGKAAVMKDLTNGIGFGSTEFYALRPKDEADSYYLYHFISQKKFRQEAERNMTGAVGLRRVPKAWLAEQEVPLPETLPEQRRIVAEIEKQFTRLDAGVEGLKRVQANLKRYRASVLKAACEGKLVPTEAALVRDRGQKSEDRGRQGFESGEELLERILTERRKAHEEQQKTAKRKSKYKEPAAPDTKDFPDLPEGWVWTGFEQISSGEKNAIKAGPFGSALKKSYYTPSGYKIYGQEQVINGNPYYGDYFISEDRYESLKSCVVKSGDILISLVGTTGRVLILPKDCAPGIINPRLLKLSLNHRGVNAKYIQVLLAAPQTKAFFKIEAHGGTMDVLNLTILKSLPIPLPPLAEQKRIVEEVERRLSVVEEMEAVVEANLKRAACLRQSILKKAFEGELV